MEAELDEGGGGGVTSEAAVLSLDSEQQAIAEAPVDSRLLVTAGAGTGKTRTLLARAEWLVYHEGLEPATELLILSFSRAAVETVVVRGGAETDLGRLPVRTFDSLAASLLSAGEVPTLGMSFEARIAAALKLLRDGDPEPLTELRHVLVDEAQDVVGVRAEFVLELLRVVAEHGAGFTVFGDEAQAIYDFQMREGGSTSANRHQLLTDLPESGLGPDQVRLTTNYRMSGDRLSPLAQRFGDALRGAGARNPMEILRELRQEIGDEPAWTEDGDAAAEIDFVTSADWCESAAVLCRHNAEVLRLGAKLQGAGLDVKVQHRAEDRGGAPWLALLFESARYSKADIPNPIPDIGSFDWFRPPPDLAVLLRHTHMAGGNEVDLSRLAARLRAGTCPEELRARRDALLTVSTIHRAKGLEFDAVFVVKNDREPESQFAEEEARVLYVGATRARVELVEGSPVEFEGPFRSKNNDGRTTVCSWGKPHRPRFLEIRVSDSDPDWAGADKDGFERIQTTLRSSYLPGDQVELRRCGGPDDAPIYEAIHLSKEPVTVGRTSEQFGRCLTNLVWGRPPTSITDLVAEIPDAAAMRTELTKAMGLGPHGLHLRARFFGLGRLRWE